MFENVGSKLKGLAAIFFWIGCIALIIFCIMTLSTASKLPGSVVAFLVFTDFVAVGLGIFGCWVMAACIYGIGTSAENTAEILRLLRASNKTSASSVKTEESQADNILYKYTEDKFNVSLSNINLPIIPTDVNIKACGNSGYISINAFIKDNIENLAVKCDVVFKTVFEDIITIQDVRFFKFTGVVGNNYISEEYKYYNADINVSSIAACDVVIKKLINNKDIIVINENDYPFEDVAGYVGTINNNCYSNGAEILEEAKKLNSGLEVYNFLNEIKAPQALIREIKIIADSERSYGKMLNSALYKIKKYYQLDVYVQDAVLEKTAMSNDKTMQTPIIQSTPAATPTIENEKNSFNNIDKDDVNKPPVMFCGKCGSKLFDNSRFCSKCGNPV